MLVEITCGYTSPHEEEAGSAGLADRCRAIVRHRLPRLYRLVVALGRCPRHARQPTLRCLVFLGQWWKEYCFER